MAFVTNETAVVRNAGDSPATIRVYGTYLNSAGGTGGIIAAGYTNSSGTLTAVSPVTGSIGGRTILNYTLTPTLSDATAPGAAKSYNTSVDAEIITIVTTADTGGIYMLECLDNGS